MGGGVGLGKLVGGLWPAPHVQGGNLAKSGSIFLGDVGVLEFCVVFLMLIAGTGLLSLQP